MTTFARAHHAALGSSRVSEAVADVALTAGAAAFTAVMWLSIGGFVLPQARAVEEQAQARSVTHVTLPSVTVVGWRDSIEGSPVATTTAQNTAAIPVNLRQ